MPQSALPNFFIVGAGKAGTTSLYNYLKQHPQIYMSPVKEPSYFASEIRAENLSEPFLRHVRRQSRELGKVLDDRGPARPLGWLALEWDNYMRLFQRAAGEVAIGEATPSYLWSESAPRNIRYRIPAAKIIMILRDPAERAFSQYLHQRAEGLTRFTFREQIEKRVHSGPKISVLYPFLEIGLYYGQVKRYLDLFPRENIRIYWYEEAWREPSRLLADVFEFLNVDPTFKSDTSRKSLERRAPRLAAVNYFLKKYDFLAPAKRLVPSSLRPSLGALAFERGNSLVMDLQDRRHLIGYYREDIQKLAMLMDRDLSAWLR